MANTEIRQDLFPAEEEIFGWIRESTVWPHRKTGTMEGQASAEHVKKKFIELGLPDAEIEQADSVVMDMEAYELFIDGKQIEAFYSNASNRQGELGVFEVGSDNAEHEIVYLGKGAEEDFLNQDVKGKIVICDVTFHENHPSKILGWNENSAVIGPEEKIHKPLRKYDIFTPKDWPFNYLRAMKGGAAGFVGVLHHFMDCHYYHEDTTNVVQVGQWVEGCDYMALPAMWVSKADGLAIIEKINSKGSAKGLIKMKTVYKKAKANNVYATLEGMSDEIILIHSHHDAVCEGAVQDASGMSEVFALAKYFSQFDKKDRPKTLMFLATDSHYCDYEGHVTFLQNRLAAGEKIIIDIVVEHIAKEMDLGEDLSIIETGEPETRMLWVSDIGGLPGVVKGIFERNKLDKTVLFPVDKFDGGAEFKNSYVCSDATVSWVMGIPVVSVLAAPMYLFHNSDRLEKVYKDDLRPIGLAFAEIVQYVMDHF